MSNTKYGRLRELGKCVRCKKDNPTPESQWCPECAVKVKTRNKQDREWFKERGICTLCRQERAVKGKTLCPNCSDRMKATNKATRDKWSEEDRQHTLKIIKEARIRRIERRLSQGLCIKCGKHKIAKNSTRECEYCLIKKRAYNKQYREKKLDEQGILTQKQRIERGLCYWCGDPYEPNGTRFCEKCREKARQRTRNQDKSNWLKWHKRENALLFARKG